MIKSYDDIDEIFGKDCDAYTSEKYWYVRVHCGSVDFYSISDIEDKGLTMIGSGMHLGELHYYFRAEISNA